MPPMHQRPWFRHYDTWVPTRLRYPQTPLQDFLRVATNVAPDKPALNYLGVTLSFRQLRLASLRLATATGQIGACARETGWPSTCPTAPST